MPDPIVVTGSASGIGRALTEQLVAAGQAVIGIDVTDDAAAGAEPIVADLSDPAAIDAAVARLPAHLAGVANVAGLPGSHPPAKVLAVNALAPRRLAAALGTRLAAGSALVIVSSVAAFRSPLGDDDVDRVLGADGWDPEALVDALALDGPGAYDFSKKVVNQLALQTAAAWAGTGVRCLTVSPGPVETPILADFAATMGQASMQASVDIVGRHGRPGEVASVVAFALGAGATWVNAVDLRVDGGLLGLRGVRQRVGS